MNIMYREEFNLFCSNSNAITEERFYDSYEKWGFVIGFMSGFVYINYEASLEMNSFNILNL